MRKSIIFISVMLIALLITIGTVKAETIYIEQLDYNAQLGWDSTQEVAQSFTIPLTTTNITNISFLIKKFGTPNDLTVTLYESDGVGGLPGTVLASQVIPKASIQTDYTWTSVFNVGVDLSGAYWSNKKYIGLSGSIDTSTNGYMVRGQSYDDYIGGDWYREEPTGWNIWNTYDGTFNITLETATFTGTTSFSKSLYNVGEIGTLTYTLDNPDFDNYNYRLFVYKSGIISQDFDLYTRSGTKQYTFASNGTYQMDLFYSGKTNNAQGTVTGSSSVANASDITIESFVSFDSDEYYQGSTASISYGVTPSIFDLNSYKLVLYVDDIFEDTIDVSSIMGIRTLSASKIGTYKVDLEQCLWSCSVIASDTAKVSVSPSYITAPSKVVVGNSFDVTYVWGVNPSNIGISNWMYVDWYDDASSTWVREQPWMLPSGISQVSYTESIYVKKSGKYMITLCDLNNPYLCPAASIIIEAEYGGNTPRENYTTSNVTIINELNTYSQGDTLNFMYRVGGNYYNSTSLRIEIAHTGTGINTTWYNVNKESEIVYLFLGGSIPLIAGESTLQLVATNDTGTWYLASDTLTIATIDSNGYGLYSQKYVLCDGESTIVTAVLPVGVNGTITFTDSTESTVYNMSGTRTFTIRPSSDTTISLDVLTIQQKMINIDVNDQCGFVEDDDKPISNNDLGTNIISLFDGWFGNSPATHFIIAIILIIIAGYLTIRFTGHTGLSVGVSVLAMGGTIVIGLLPMVWGVIAVVIAGVLFAKKAREGF